MKILCLYHNPCALELFQWLKERGNQTILHTGKLEPEWCREQRVDLTVSYTYRHILSKETLEALGGNAVNLHNSYLPFNRGADPNIWSALEGTPRGVTLHYMSEGLDKGSIIAQRLLGDWSREDTLASSYEELDRTAKGLFMDAFKWYEFWEEMRKEPRGQGSYHSVKDGGFVREMADTYDIRIDDFRERYECINNVCRNINKHRHHKEYPKISNAVENNRNGH